MKALKQIHYDIAKAKTQRDVDWLNGYTKALYEYDRITYEEFEHIKALLNERHAELVT